MNFQALFCVIIYVAAAAAAASANSKIDLNWPNHFRKEMCRIKICINDENIVKINFYQN